MPDITKFIDDLPELLRRLSNPTTPFTAIELRCRIAAFGWNRCFPTLRSELQSGQDDVRRLVLAVISEEADQSGPDAVVCLLPQVTNCLNSENRLLRQAAILVVESLGVMTESVADALRKIVTQDESAIAREALTVLVQHDDTAMKEITDLLRGRWCQ